MPHEGQPIRFIGRFYHALEQKGRVSIPPSFRELLGESAILTRGLDGCLFLFPESQFEREASLAANLPLTQKQARDWVRLLANNAEKVTFDSLGRILIPDYLRDLGQLTKNLVIVGSLNHLEIWNQTTYHTYIKNLDAQAETIAESLTPEKI